MATLYTIGHGARSAAELISMLREAAIESRAGRGHRVVHLLAAGRSREHVLHPQEELWRDD
jgi:hypothetical protein